MSLKLDRDGKEFTGGSFKANSLVFQGHDGTAAVTAASSVL